MAEETKGGPGFFKTIGRFIDYAMKPSFVKSETKDRDDLYWEKYPALPFFSDFNAFALQLQKVLEVGGTHRGCVYSKADFISGGRLTLHPGVYNDILVNRTATDDVTPKDKAVIAANEFLKRVNPQGQSIVKIIREIAVCFEGYGNCYMEEVRGTVAGDKFYHIYIHSPEKCLYVDNKGDESLTHIWVSNYWGPWYLEKHEPVKLPINKWEKVGFAERRVTILKADSPGRDTYGLPPAVASILHSLLELEIPSHNLDKFYTDFMPKVFMQFFSPKGMKPEEEKKFYDGLIQTYTRQGGKRRSMFAQVVESEAMKANIHEFSNQTSDGEFLGLTDKTEFAIFKAHRWHPILAGVPTANGLNNSAMVRNIFDIYNALIIQPRQQMIMTDMVNPAFQRAAEWLGTGFNDHYLQLTSIMPLTFVGDLSINKILTKNEGRKIIGFDALVDEEKGNEFIDGGSATTLQLMPPGKEEDGEQSTQTEEKEEETDNGSK